MLTIEIENIILNVPQSPYFNSLKDPHSWPALQSRWLPSIIPAPRGSPNSGFIQPKVLDMDVIDWHVILSNTHGSSRDTKAWIGYKKFDLTCKIQFLLS